MSPHQTSKVGPRVGFEGLDGYFDLRIAVVLRMSTRTPGSWKLLEFPAISACCTTPLIILACLFSNLETVSSFLHITLTTTTTTTFSVTTHHPPLSPPLFLNSHTHIHHLPLALYLIDITIIRFSLDYHSVGQSSGKDLNCPFAVLHSRYISY